MLTKWILRIHTTVYYNLKILPKFNTVYYNLKNLFKLTQFIIILRIQQSLTQFIKDFAKIEKVTKVCTILFSNNEN